MQTCNIFYKLIHIRANHNKDKFTVLVVLSPLSFNGVVIKKRFNGQPNDRLNFTISTFLPWRILDTLSKSRRATRCSAWITLHSAFVFTEIPSRMMSTPPRGQNYRAMLRKRPLWRNAYWWHDQSESPSVRLQHYKPVVADDAIDRGPQAK